MFEYYSSYKLLNQNLGEFLDCRKLPRSRISCHFYNFLLFTGPDSFECEILNSDDRYSGVIVSVPDFDEKTALFPVIEW